MPNLSESLIVAIAIIIAVVVLIVPLMLRVAGLTGSQIVDVLTLTMKFTIDLIGEFRADNKAKP